MKHIELALSQYGVKEIVGKEDNPEVLKYFKNLGFDSSVLKDETAWCAAFANWVLRESGLPFSGKLNARSFLEVGEKVVEPSLGDLVIFWRESPDSWKGHVAFYINDDDNYIYVLGGNQSNQVCIKPYAKRRLLTYIRLNKRL
jgi:uncharacterized protein (TIGR02594 family)